MVLCLLSTSPCTYIRTYEKHRPLLKLRSKSFDATYLLLSVSSRVGFSFNFALREAALCGFFAGYFNNLKDLLFPNRFNVNPGSNVSVKSKLQHAPPRATPRAFDFFEIFCSNSPLPGPRCRSNAPH